MAITSYYQGREEPEQKKRTQAKNQNKKDRTRGSVFCLWRSAQRQTADGRRATHGGQTPTTHQKAVGALGNWTHLTGCIITSHTPYHSLSIASQGNPNPGFSKTRQEEINALPGLSVPSPPICSRPCAPPQSLELTGRASCFGMAVRGFAGPERTTGFGVSALPAIDGHPDKQSFRGSRSRASSPQSHGSKEKGSPRVGEVRAACRRAGKSVQSARDLCTLHPTQT